jgi:hypothetical protein
LIVVRVHPSGFFLTLKVSLPGNLVPEGLIRVVHILAGLGIPVALIPTLVGNILTII